MWDKVLYTMNNYRSHKIFVGCSSGIDSMVLSDFLLRYKFCIHLLHVNYQRRGKQSDGDAQFVKDFAEKHNIPCDIRLYSNKEGGNFQQQARIFRYNFFEEMLQKENGVIALAHHADDNIETFFINLSRKSGVMGLAGIPKIRSSYIRPMLHLQKQDIIYYAEKHAVKWRDDYSNFSTDYYRNRWRLEFLPTIERHIPTIKTSTLTIIDAFVKTQQYLENKMSKVANNIKQTMRFPIIYFDQYSKEELFELWRQLQQSPTLFERFIELKNYTEGKFIETKPPFQRIVKEKTYLLFIKTEVQEKTPRINIQIIDQLPNKYSKNELYLDPEKIQGDLRVRKWLHGDRIASIGIDGTQSVAKIIKDAKITHDKRNSILVVCDNINIHWVVGLKIGRKAQPTQNKKRSFKITLIS